MILPFIVPTGIDLLHLPNDLVFAAPYKIVHRWPYRASYRAQVRAARSRRNAAKRKGLR